MLNFIVKEGAKPKLSKAQLDSVRSFLSKRGIVQTNFSEEELWSITEMIFALKFDGGKPIPHRTAEMMSDAFGGLPKRFVASSTLINAFIDKINLHILPPPPPTELVLRPGYELGLRFHIGMNNRNEYGVVMVPIAGLIPAPGANRTHYGELENGLFADANIPWFGLTFTDWTRPGNGRPVELAEAQSLIQRRDQIGTTRTKIVYILYSAFLEILSKLSRPYDQMVVKFGRTLDSEQALTVILMFYDEKGDPVSLNGDLPVEVGAVCFDQGDLMPPPDVPDTDTSINPQ